jgi:hypothetical protein
MSSTPGGVSAQFPEAHRLLMSIQRILGTLESGLYDEKLYQRVSRYFGPPRWVANLYQHVITLTLRQAVAAKNLVTGYGNWRF